MGGICHPRLRSVLWLAQLLLFLVEAALAKLADRHPLLRLRLEKAPSRTVSAGFCLGEAPRLAQNGLMSSMNAVEVADDDHSSPRDVSIVGIHGGRHSDGTG